MATLDIAVPTSRLVNPETGFVEAPWRQFLTILLQRTGGTVGHDSAGSLAAETTARQNGDAANATAINNEKSRAEAAEAGLVQVSQLRIQWSILDLSTLPTSNPGSGRPWLSSGAVRVGP